MHFMRDYDTMRKNINIWEERAMKRKMCALLAMAMLMFCGISGAAAEQAEV